MQTQWLEPHFGIAPHDPLQSAVELTCAVLARSTLRVMEKPLEPGDELRFPHCRRWHPVAATSTSGTEYTRLMVFWKCRGQRYYAGQLGTPSRHEIRQLSSR
jgi:hypothetical protein